MTNITRKTKVYPILIFSLSFALFSLIVYRGFFYTPASDILQVQTFRVSGGWGYKIIVGDKVFIDQPFIPVLQGKKPFPDRKSALRAAKTIKAKMLLGKLPNLSREDIQKIGIDSLGNSN
jgi:hypothetical protein